MKYIILTIFILLAAPPLRASLADMCDAQKTTSAQYTDQYPDMGDQDCCDYLAADASVDCDSMPHCGSCVAGVNVLDIAMADVIDPVDSRQYVVSTNGPFNPFSSPPFRPPIS